MEMTMVERLIQFINDLTDEECEMIVSHLDAMPEAVLTEAVQ